jgi:predicted kinase
VMDATFIDPGLRIRAEQLARDCGAPFDAVWLDAPVEVLEQRVASRTNDASDATVEVLRAQVARLDDPAIAWRRVDALGDVEEASHHAF